MQTRRLGRTGHHSSLAILAGAAFAMDTPDDAAEFLHEAVDAGINHLDIVAAYGFEMGPWCSEVVAGDAGELGQATLTSLKDDLERLGALVEDFQ